MILTRIRLQNFRCHEDVVLKGLDRLVVLVGENDVGKTVLLDAIEYLLEPKRVVATDYREQPDGTPCGEAVIEGEFKLEDHDRLPAEWCCGPSKGLLRLRKRYTPTGTVVEVEGVGFVDGRFDVFSSTKAPEQQALLREVGITPASRKEDRLTQVQELAESGRLATEMKQVEVRFPDVYPHLPQIERTNSSDYADPRGLIRDTLKNVAQRVIRPAGPDGERVEDTRLQGVRADINEALGTEIDKAEDALKSVHPSLQRVHIEANIDFGNAVSSVELDFDVGEGRRALSQLGLGTNRRMWMGLQDWKRETTRDAGVGSVISLYDEPDTNLHVRAQQKLFEHLSSRANDPANRTQCVICTHSVHLIDRAPANVIRLLEADDEGRRSATGIPSTEAADVRHFLDDLGRSLGLTNTALLYERAFLVVEGHSEKEAVPILYKTLFGRTVTEDGIIVVNLHTCSAWQAALQVLFESRREFVHFLLDQDCTFPGSSANLTPERIMEAGADAEFLTERVTFVGTKEYEDAFDDDVIARALNDEFPREDEDPWEAGHIAPLRSEDKFSVALQQQTLHRAKPHLRTRAKKIEIAVAMAKTCQLHEVPVAVQRAFGVVRFRAGLDTGCLLPRTTP